MLKILSKIASVIKSQRFTAFIEKLEKAAVEREKNRRLAKALKHSKSIYRQKRKSTYC